MTIASDNVVAFTSRSDAADLTEHVDQLISEHVATATEHYRHHEPGRGEFVLQRLALRLGRLTTTTTPTITGDTR